MTTFLVGLREDSRVVMRLNKRPLTLSQQFSVMQYDLLNMLLWTKTKDAKNNKNKPKSLLDKIMHPEVKEKVNSYSSGKEFEEAYRRIVGG